MGSAEEIEERNRRLAAFDEQRAKHRAEAAEENNLDSTEGDDENADAEREAMLVGMRVARMNMSNDDEESHEKKERKAKGLEGIIEIDNPNKTRGSGMVKIKDLASTPTEQMTRKQREEAEKAAKAAAYRKRHEMGLTEEYKRDMAKLAEVRKRREEAEARAKAQTDMENAVEEERKKKAAEAGALNEEDGKKSKSSKKKKSKDDDIPKLDKIAIKKMKPTQLKEALKARGLEIQGNAKQLTERLLEYEKKR